jgi:hypothetical protein
VPDAPDEVPPELVEEPADTTDDELPPLGVSSAAHATMRMLPPNEHTTTARLVLDILIATSRIRTTQDDGATAS